MKPQFWQDMGRTIPAQIGDKVAVIQDISVDGVGLATFTQPDEARRPTLGHNGEAWTCRFPTDMAMNVVKIHDPRYVKVEIIGLCRCIWEPMP